MLFITAGIDVQKNRLIYVIRGWGSRQESWLTNHGWRAMGTDPPACGLFSDVVPEHRVDEYVRRNPRQDYATKAYLQRLTPLSCHEAVTGVITAARSFTEARGEAKPSGGFAWVEKSSNNHRLDCEAFWPTPRRVHAGCAAS